MKKKLTLAHKMFIALLLGLICGIVFLSLRESLISSNQSETWDFINNLLFKDLSSPNSIGIFYIIGQLFVNCLQLVIVPMVFTSITLAICHISDTKKLGRISLKTLLTFLLTSITALLFAGLIGMIAYNAGVFNPINQTIETASTSVGGNPLSIILNIIPNNITSILTTNTSILAVVFVAICTGLAVNHLNDKITILKSLLVEVNKIVVLFLSFVVNNFAPIGVFVLLTRTFASYGIDYLIPALSYVVVVVITLILYLIFGYAGFVSLLAKLNPINFVKKVLKVAVFGFSTSSSAATLPLNQKVCVEELGVPSDVASFVLPLGMTINMDGTAIMQVIAAIFIAASSGYEVTFFSITVIALLALVASIGTPAAPGAGAVILFTILSGMGYTNELALMAYSLILAINRPVEMLVTALNVVGDASTSIIVAKSENTFNESIYNQTTLVETKTA